MDNFIRRYDDIITPEKCQYFIDKFEANPEIHLVQDNSRGATLTKINLLGYWTSTWHRRAQNETIFAGLF